MFNITYEIKAEDGSVYFFDAKDESGTEEYL